MKNYLLPLLGSFFGIMIIVPALFNTDKIHAQDISTCTSFTDDFSDTNLSNHWIISADGDASRAIVKDGNLYLTDTDPGPLQALVDTPKITAGNFTVSIDVLSYNSAVVTDGNYAGNFGIQLINGDIGTDPNYYTNTKTINFNWVKSSGGSILQVIQTKAYTQGVNNTIEIDPAGTVTMKLVKNGETVSAYADDILVGTITDVTDNTFSIRLIVGAYRGSQAQVMSGRLDNFKLTCGKETEALNPESIDSSISPTSIGIPTVSDPINDISTNALLLIVIALMILILIVCLVLILRGRKQTPNSQL